MEAEKQKRIDDILKSARDYLTSLVAGKKTGQYEIALEINLTQGGIGNTYLKNQTKEKI